MRPGPQTEVTVGCTYTDTGEFFRIVKRTGVSGKPYLMDWQSGSEVSLHRILAPALQDAGYDYDGDYDSINHFELVSSCGSQPPAGTWKLEWDSGRNRYRTVYSYTILITATFGAKP